jgi:ABC-type glycerol-3-phosphate transport system substrate-binding protein
MTKKLASAKWIIVLVAVVCLVGGIMVSAQDDGLTVSYMESGTYNLSAEQLAGEFESANGIPVEVVAFPWAVLRQNNTNDLISGTGLYDVMSGGYYLADVYDFFIPLTSYIESSNFGDGIIPGLMDPGSSEWYNGEQIGIPYGVDAYGLIVNNALLEEAGVTPEFANWEEFLAACETIEAALEGVACFSHSTGNPEQIGAFFFSGYDGNYVNADGAYQLDVEQAVAAASLLPELWTHLPENGAALSFEEAHQVFMDGDAAMTVTWPSFIAQTLDAPDSGMAGNWSQVAFPGPAFPWLSLWQQFIPASATNPDAAWQWASTFAGEERAMTNYTDYGINSIWLSTYEDEELAAQHAHQWPEMLDGFSRAKNPPLSGEAQDFLTNTLVQVATGQLTAEEGIAQVNDAWATIPVPAPLLEAATLAGMRAE